MQDYTLILASASPRRAQLLREAGYEFTVRPSPYEEPAEGLNQPPAQHAESLSYFKARSVADELSAGIVLGADTVVAYGGHIFGKPADADDAKRILGTLAGTTHEVITGVTLIDAAGERRLIKHEITRVRMRPMSLAALDAYIATKAWQGKAGAYGIQDHDDAFVECMDGSFSNVVGLPMELLGCMLVDFVLNTSDD